MDALNIAGVILCEGETDQVLISSYLEQVAGWKHLRNKRLPVFAEGFEWYRRDSGRLLGIWPVGSHEFGEALRAVIDFTRKEACVDRLVVVTDHDDSSAESKRMEDTFKAALNMLGSSVDTRAYSPNHWYSVPYLDDFSVKASIDVGYLLVPSDQIGALETFMMDALAGQDSEKQTVIQRSKGFVAAFDSQVYLTKRRERVKAELGVSMAVFSPDKVFSTMRELIESVDWSLFDSAHRQFDLLRQIG